MATPPFLPDETKPASSDLISAFPAAEQTFRDIIEDWLLTLSTTSGVIKNAAFPAAAEFTDTLWSGVSAGAISDVPSFAQRLATNSTGDTALSIETTDTSGVVGILFNIGTTAYGQIRYLHASEDMTFYTNDALQMTLDANGLELVTGNAFIGEFQAADGSAASPSYAFDNDGNTGWYSLAANRIGGAVGGTLMLELGSDELQYRGDRFLVGPGTYDGLSPGDVGISLQGDGAGTPGAYSGTVSAAACIFINRLASNGNIVEFYRQSDFIAAISITTAAVSYNTTSDARRKENARDFDSGGIIDRLQMYEFDWRDGSGVGYGPLAAADTAAVFPSAFTYSEEDDLWMADYSKLVPVLWEEVALLRLRVADLEDA
jgi:hypothetical protein